MVARRVGDVVGGEGTDGVAGADGAAAGAADPRHCLWIILNFVNIGWKMWCRVKCINWFF